eukprot:TRINITY_DN1027_c0_g1_i1.p1 TRINITY_DN1027_c0_g1~~TRINITY_DN1027_c0_g1_i1.p1  ORF type:complete len:271 (-),score=131.41 TRINITY_DN1027_c0_g1_i1:62-874(-)
METNLKCVVVGDGAVGKTATLVSFSTKNFVEDYSTTQNDCFFVNAIFQNQPITIQLCDTSAQDDPERRRLNYYNGANSFIVMYSVTSQYSLQNACELWVTELRRFAPEIPLILVGNKADLRKDSDVQQRLSERGLSMVTKEQGRSAAKKVGATIWLECSAKNQKNLTKLIEAVIKISINDSILEAKLNLKNKKLSSNSSKSGKIIFTNIVPTSTLSTCSTSTSTTSTINSNSVNLNSTNLVTENDDSDDYEENEHLTTNYRTIRCECQII